MLEQIKHEFMRLRGELSLLGVALLAFLIFGISRGNAEVIFYKIALLAVASIAVHICRQISLPYICIEDCVFGDAKWAAVPVPIRTVTVGGMLFLYTVLVHGILVAG